MRRRSLGEAKGIATFGANRVLTGLLVSIPGPHQIHDHIKSARRHNFEIVVAKVLNALSGNLRGLFTFAWFSASLAANRYLQLLGEAVLNDGESANNHVTGACRLAQQEPDKSSGGVAGFRALAFSASKLLCRFEPVKIAYPRAEQERGLCAATSKPPVGAPARTTSATLLSIKI
jgi:hypothetical protein